MNGPTYWMKNKCVHIGPRINGLRMDQVGQE